MPPRWQVDAVLARLRSGAADLAGALLELDAANQRQLGGPLAPRGRTAAVAADVAARLAWLWDAYRELNGMLAAADAVRGEGTRLGGRRAERLQALLTRELMTGTPTTGTPTTGTPASGPPTPAAPEALLDRATRTVDELRARLAEVAAAQAEQHAVLGPVARELTRLTATAQRLAVTDCPELDAALAAVAAARTAVVADPLDVPPGLLTAATASVPAAATLLATLAHAFDHLDSELAAAEALLARVVEVTLAGERSAREVLERVTGDPAGLRQLDDGWFDAPRYGLRSWLDRLSAAGAAGEWRLVAHGLPAWRRIAEETLATASAVAASNAAPVRRRDELRGLLRALRAKAGRTGLIESAELEARHERAVGALGTAPIDLDAAEALVRAYGDALLTAAAVPPGHRTPMIRKEESA